ncbi:hypothetical protein N7G274_000707 [Stereocaulon virgatum]|uniref:MARVEL domain-containing protein n=1 Tax=Stereocaulon virgatum TaxID=373712 RepID=A0ABR4AQB2_9LECA
MVDLSVVALGIHAIQFIFAIIVLGLTGHATAVVAVDRTSFELFVALWTILILVFLAVVPRVAEKIAHPFVMVALNALTMLFWFAAFIAVAVYRHAINDYGIVGYTPAYDFVEGLCSAIGRSYCGSVAAAAAFGAFEWALFALTTALAVFVLFKGRQSGTKTTNGTHMQGTTV